MVIERQEEPSTCGSLLQRAVDGSADSWRQLVQVYGPVIYGWARRCGCQSADAADVMQNTLVSVAAALTRFHHDQPDGSFRGWLWMITRNKIIDQHRQASERGVGGTDALISIQQMPSGGTQHDCLPGEEPPGTLQSDMTTVRRRVLELLRDSFDPRQWRMFWETTALQRDPADVAAELGVSRWAVYKARARVLQRLKEEMSGLE